MADQLATLPADVAAGLGEWSKRVGLGRKLAVLLAAASIASAVATYLAFTGSLQLGSGSRTVLILLYLDLVLFLLLGSVVARRIVGLWMERRRGSAGSRMHTRLVLLFSLVAVTPAIVVALFSAMFFNFGLQEWFSSRVSTAVKESLAVAEAYLLEHQQAMRGDIFAMAKDLNTDAADLSRDPWRFSQTIRTQGLVRNLSEAIIYDSTGRVLAHWTLSFVLDLDRVPVNVIDQARGGELVLLISPTDDRMRAVLKLDNYFDAYLYVARYIEPRVLNHIQRARRAAAQYESLEGQARSFEITFAMIFVLVALLVLLAAIWLGLTVATQLVHPIGILVAAAERVRAGDLSARVPEGVARDELGTFSRAFNRMAEQIETQQRELVEANRQLETRRHFIETVLSGVSAGVLGLDSEGRLNVANRTAGLLLGTDLDTRVGERLSEFIPELGPLLEKAMLRPDRLLETQIGITRARRPGTMLVRIVCEQRIGDITGFVVTFDDVTELLAAQRNAAWADVARRIAHEIKNPLTPIQLSAERLKRKYLKEIKNDPETFSVCTDTIIRQVGDIGRMVDEFSSFARMPAPTMKRENLVDLVKRAVFLHRNGHLNIELQEEYAESPLFVVCDSRQVGQALTNLVKNAVEAITERETTEGVVLPPGIIWVRLVREGGQVVVEVADNGKGLPADRESLTEPYVTTRVKGTGLGLAIVRKIMEDHDGELQLEDRVGGGSRVRIVFGRTTIGPSEKEAVGLPNTAETAPHGA